MKPGFPFSDQTDSDPIIGGDTTSCLDQHHGPGSGLMASSSCSDMLSEDVELDSELKEGQTDRLQVEEPKSDSTELDQT